MENSLKSYESLVPAKVKFYNLKGKTIGFYKDYKVFPNFKDGTKEKIVNFRLYETTINVYLRNIRNSNNENYFIASIKGNPLKTIETQENIFDCAPIVLIDGQNFLKDIISLKLENLVSKILVSIFKKFKLPPKKIVFYSCKTCNPIHEEELLENIKKTISSLEIRYLKSKYNYYKNTTKTDIDPILLSDLGIIIEKTKGNKECLVLFTGDSDYETPCRQWLGEEKNVFGEDYIIGRKLVIVSSIETGSFSSNLKDVCNNPNAKAILIENFRD